MMTHGPEHHLEHAEHASHAAHDRFDRQVTISIAIIAAVLAFITMLGHREHNNTLRLQGEALAVQMEAGREQAEMVNDWTRYQAVNVRSHNYKSAADQAEFVATTSGKEVTRTATRDRWLEKHVEYENQVLPDLKES